MSCTICTPLEIQGQVPAHFNLIYFQLGFFNFCKSETPPFVSIWRLNSLLQLMACINCAVNFNRLLIAITKWLSEFCKVESIWLACKKGQLQMTPYRRLSHDHTTIFVTYINTYKSISSLFVSHTKQVFTRPSMSQTSLSKPVMVILCNIASNRIKFMKRPRKKCFQY